MQQTIGKEIYVDPARKFCAWIEGPPMQPDSGVKTAIILLSNLYNEALHLPGGSGDEDTDFVLPEPTDREIDAMRERFENLPIESYLVAQPLTNDNRLERYCPFETFAFVYKYTKDGLDLYESGKQASAIDHWSRGFRHHWGVRITAFIYTLHTYASQNRLL